MRAAGVFDRLSEMGAAAQASVPGLYAWGVTVVPVAWARGSSAAAKVAAIFALVALVAGVVCQRRWGGRVRLPALWGFVAASALAWSAAPAALGPLRMDGPRGVAGMLGWALFALATAAPALEGRRAPGRIVEGAPLAPRKPLARGDGLYVAAGALLAASLQAIGWRIASAERAVLVRVVSLAAGIALLGAATEIALARHVPRAPSLRRSRLRRAALAFAVLALLALFGLVYAFQE